MPTVFNAGKLDKRENRGLTLVEEGLFSGDERRLAMDQIRAGLYILRSFPENESVDLFETLGIPHHFMPILMKHSFSTINFVEKDAVTVTESESVTKKLPSHGRPGQINGHSKVSDEIVRKIRKDFDEHNYTSLKNLANKYQLARSTVTGIGQRKAWKHVPEK